MANGRLNFTVGFNVDQSGLNQLKTSLMNLEHIKIGANATDEMKQDLQEVQRIAGQVRTALSSSFNTKLNTYNLDAFKQSLQGINGGLAGIKTAFATAGAQGTTAFRNLAVAVSSTTLPLKESHNLLRSMGTTLTNTLKWTIASSAINSVTSSVQKAWTYTKELDKSLNSIMLVTDKSADYMDRFAKQANKAAKELGKSTTDYTNAALIYYQQGLSDQEVAQRTETTLKASNVTGQSADAVSEQLTAVWNGYKVQAQETELYIDKLSAVAASTASDLEELSTGMSKVASAANNMGVDIDQLNGLLSTAISVTRQAPETVGTAFKTIFARISDIESNLDDETTFGEYTSQMANLGFSVLDANGKLRDMGEVVEEIGNKWNDLSREQQIALAQTMAGTRQYNNLLAVFENWDMYQSAVKTSSESAGFLQKQQDEYMESMAAHLEQLSAAGERVYDALFNPDAINPVIDILAEGVDLIGSFVESIGGGGTLLMALVPTMTFLFSGTIANGVSTFAVNLMNARNNAQALATALGNAQEMLSSGTLDAYSKKLVELEQNFIKLRQANVITNEQFNDFTNTLHEMTSAANQYDLAVEKLQGNAKIGKLGTGERFNRLVANEYFSGDDRFDQSAALLGQDKINALFQDGENNFGKGLSGTAAQSDSETFLNVEESLERMRSKFREVKTEAEGAKTAIQNIDAAKVDPAGIEKLKANFEKLKINADQLASTPFGKQLQAQVSYVSQGFTTLINSTELTADQIEMIKTKSSQLEVLITKMANAGEKEVAELRKEFEMIVDGALPRMRAGIEQSDAALKNKMAREQLELRIQGLTRLASSAAMVASAFQMVKNLGSIWDNEDLSYSEKFLQTVQNLGFALTMLLPTVSSVIGLTKKHTAAKAEETVAIATATAAEETSTILAQKKALADNLIAAGSIKKGKAYLDTALAQGVLTEEEYKELLAHKTGEPYRAKKIGNLLMQKIAEDQAAASTAKQTLATEKETKANYANAASQAAKYLYIALIVAAIAALTIATIASVKASQKEADAFKQASERAKELNSNLRDVKSGYDDLKSSIDNLKDMKSSLEELTVGTQEWKDAILEANTAALELLNTYPELANYLAPKGSNGLISFTDEGYNAILTNQYQKVLSAQTASVIGQKNQQQASMVLQQEELRRNMQTFDFDSVVKGIVSTTTGWLGPLEYLYNWEKLALDAATGEWGLGFYDDFARGDNLYADQLNETEMETLIQAVKENPQKLAEENADWLKGILPEVEDSQLYDAIISNKEEIISLTEQMKALEETYKLQNQQIYESELNKRGIEGQDATILSGIMSGFTDTADQIAWVEERTKTLRKKYGNNEQLIKEWAAATGVEIDEGSIKGTGGANFKYRVDGEEKTMSYDALAEELAEYQFYNKQFSDGVAFQAQKLYDSVKDLVKSTEGFDAATKVLINNTDIAAEEFEDFSWETIKELKAFTENATELTEDQKANLISTYESMQTYLKDMGAIRGWTTSEALSTSQKGSFAIQEAVARILGAENWNDIYSQYSKKLLASIGDGVSKFANVGGETARKAFEEFATSFDNEVQRNKFFEKINWDSQTLFEDIGKVSKEVGAEIDYTSSAMIQLRVYSARLNGQLVNTREGFAKVQKVLEGVEQYGASLSAEDYESLYAEYGAAMDKYFVQMRDGTYMLTSAAGAFKKAVAEMQKNSLEVELKAEAEKILAFNENLAKAADFTIDFTKGELDKEGFANAKNDFERTFNGVTFDSSDISSGKVNGQGQAIALVKEYLNTATGEEGDAATQLVNSLATGWNIAGESISEKIHGLQTQSYEVWKDIIQESGGDTVALDLFAASGMFQPVEGFEYIDYADMYSAIQKSREDDIAALEAQYKAPTVYKEEEIDNKIDQLVTQGILTAEKGAELKEVGLEVGGNDIVEQIKAAVAQVAQADTSNLITLAEQYITSASSQEELDSAWNYLNSLGINEQTLGKTAWKDLQKTANDALSINIPIRQAETYANKIEVINSLYEKQSKILNLLEKQTETLVGIDRIKGLDKQNEVLHKQNDLLKEQAKLEKEEAARQLSFKVGEKQTDVEFALQSLWKLQNPFGTEHNQSLASILKSFNISATSITAENYQEVILKIKQGLSGLSGDAAEAASDYLADLSMQLAKIFDTSTQQDLLENWQTELENNLEKFEIEIDLANSVKEATIAYNEFLDEIEDNEIIGDGWNRVYSNYTITLSTAEETAARLNEINEASLTTSQKQKLFAEETESLRESILELREYEKELDEASLNTLEKISDEYKNQRDYLNDIVELVEAQQELNKLINGEKSLEAQKKNYELQQQALNVRKETLLSSKNEFSYYAGLYQNANFTSLSQEEQDHIKSQYIELGKEIVKETTEIAKEEADIYKNYIAYTIAELDNSFGGLESLSDEWDWMQKANEGFLDNVESSYKILSLENTLTSKINNANVNAQKQLAHFRETELANLRKKDKLSEYDLERAEKKLSVLEAEIALQDAQANKTQMRLVRGKDGSYGYEYVADLEKINSAQEDLIAANESLYALDKDKYKESLEEFLTIFKEYMSYMQEAWADGQITADEAKRLEQYKEYLEDLAVINASIQGNLNESITSASDLFNKEFSNSILEQGGRNIATLIGQINEKGVQPLIQDTWNKLEQAGDDYLKSVGEKYAEIDTIIGNDNSGLIKDLNTLENAISGENGTIAAWKGEKDVIDQVKSSVDLLTSSYEFLINAATNASQAIVNAANANKGSSTLVGSVNESGYSFYKQENDENYIQNASDWATASSLLKKGDHYSIDNGATWLSQTDLDSSGWWLDYALGTRPINEVFTWEEAGNFTLSDYVLTGTGAEASQKDVYKNRLYLKEQALLYEINHTGNGLQPEDITGQTVTAGPESGIWRLDSNKKFTLGNEDYVIVMSAEAEAGKYFLAPMRSLYTTDNGLKYNIFTPSFDTGGYTGAWGSDGRLATLHEKEIVLNKHDTENFLNALDILRDLNLSMLNNYRLGLNGISQSSSMVEKFMKDFTIEQVVNINAEFPNATDKNEIEEAFKDLYNLAVQRVYER